VASADSWPVGGNLSIVAVERPVDADTRPGLPE
jgi:hypothetical protein